MGIFNRSKTEPVSATPAAGTVGTVGTIERPSVLGDFTVDPSHTRIGFSARHAMVTTVRGAFTEFEGSAHLDTAKPAASNVNITIKTASVDTGSADRNGHLQSGDFFDVEKFPNIVFASTATEQLSADTYRVNGDLTIKDVTKAVSIEFVFSGSAQDPFGNERVGFEGALTISRSDWGLTWNAALETGGVLVSDKIKIELDVSAIKTV